MFITLYASITWFRLMGIFSALTNGEAPPRKASFRRFAMQSYKEKII